MVDLFARCCGASSFPTPQERHAAVAQSFRSGTSAASGLSGTSGSVEVSESSAHPPMFLTLRSLSERASKSENLPFVVGTRNRVHNALLAAERAGGDQTWLSGDRRAVLEKFVSSLDNHIQTLRSDNEASKSELPGRPGPVKIADRQNVRPALTGSMRTVSLPADTRAHEMVERWSQEFSSFRYRKSGGDTPPGGSPTASMQSPGRSSFSPAYGGADPLSTSPRSSKTV